MPCNIHLRQKINEKEIRIENSAPFGVSFIKCLIDPRPPMSLQVASCKTHQTIKKVRKIKDITKRQYEHIKTVKTFALLTQFAMPFGSQMQTSALLKCRVWNFVTGCYIFLCYLKKMGLHSWIAAWVNFLTEIATKLGISSTDSRGSSSGLVPIKPTTRNQFLSRIAAASSTSKEQKAESSKHQIQ